MISPKQSLYSDRVDEENQPVKPVSYSVVKTGLIGLTRYTSTYWPKRLDAIVYVLEGYLIINQMNFSKISLKFQSED